MPIPIADMDSHTTSRDLAIENIDHGIIYVEAKLKDEQAAHLTYERDCEFLRKLAKNLEHDLSQDLERSLSSRSEDTWTDCVEAFVGRENVIETLDPFWAGLLDFVRPVECVQATSEIELPHNFEFKVSVFALHEDQAVDGRELYGARVSEMPNKVFEGQWEELIFDNDKKTLLLWLASNMLSLGAKGQIKRKMHPMILLYGPPGTGKTTLCHGIAQKVSIRMNTIYPTSEVIEINASELHSRFYSESAKQVSRLFQEIERLSLENRWTILFIIIDEVEGIAPSRQSGMQHGEVEDSLRATNALLTGFDRLKDRPNIFFLCTTNMIDCIDPAFLDRCGIRHAVDPPSKPCTYQILKIGLLELVVSGDLTHDLVVDEMCLHRIIPPYDEAVLLSQDDDPAYMGYKLLQIVDLLARVFKEGASGRSLVQLPQKVLLKNKRRGGYSLNDALKDMRKEIEGEYRSKGDS